MRSRKEDKEENVNVELQQFIGENIKGKEDVVGHGVFGDATILDASIDKACDDMSALTLRVKPGKGAPAFNNDIKEILVPAIIQYFDEKNEAHSDNVEFEKWHHKTCDDVLPIINCHYDAPGHNKDVKYGKAQKIVNMTFKYLYCFAEEGEREKYFKYCHIPLDNYILKALFYKMKNGSLCEKINCKYTGEGKLIEDNFKDSEKNYLVDANGHIKVKEEDGKHVIKDYGTWSNIGYKEYESIQKAVKKRIPSEFSSKPLIWENKVWTLAAEFLNNKTFIDYDK